MDPRKLSLALVLLMFISAVMPLFTVTEERLESPKGTQKSASIASVSYTHLTLPTNGEV